MTELPPIIPRAVSGMNGEHAEIRECIERLRADVHQAARETQKQITSLAVQAGRIEQKVIDLPCTERGEKFRALEAKVGSLEGVSNQLIGMGRSLKIIWAALAAAGIGTLLQIYRLAIAALGGKP